MHLRVALTAAVAPIAREDWLALCELAEEKDEHAEQHARWTCSRYTTRFEVELGWVTMLSCRFFKSKHINLLELESLISLLGSWYLWIRLWFWETSQKDDQAHEKSTSCFENWVLGPRL